MEKNNSENKEVLDVKYLEKNQLREFVKYWKKNPRKYQKRNLLIFELLIETGALVEEFSRIKIKDIHFNDNVIDLNSKVYKRPRIRQVKISSNAVKHIKEYIEHCKEHDCNLGPNDYLFGSQRQNDDKPLSDRNFRYLIAKTYKRIQPILIAKGIDLDFLPHPHVFRHTHIVYALRHGIEAEEIQEQVGHLHIDTIMMYPVDYKPKNRGYWDVTLFKFEY